MPKTDSATERAPGGTPGAVCWPLPPEWDVPIPPQPTKIVEHHGIPGISGTRPVWNEAWLRGLEQYIRSIVRDELSKAAAAHDGRRTRTIDMKKKRGTRTGSVERKRTREGEE